MNEIIELLNKFDIVYTLTDDKTDYKLVFDYEDEQYRITPMDISFNDDLERVSSSSLYYLWVGDSLRLAQVALVEVLYLLPRLLKINDAKYSIVKTSNVCGFVYESIIANNLATAYEAKQIIVDACANFIKDNELDSDTSILESTDDPLDYKISYTNGIVEFKLCKILE